MRAAQPHPSWLRVVSTTTIPSASTEVTVGGMYFIHGGTGLNTEVTISDSAITEIPTNVTSTFSLRSDTGFGVHQYIAAGQFIRGSSGGGTFSLLQ